MESGGRSSNQPEKNTTRATTSGIVIQEGGGAPAATNAAAGNVNPPEPARRVTNHYAPLANITRIMRRGLPPNAKIGEESKEIMQDCVTEFISFITDEANERCQGEYRKMITADDLLAAMVALGFDNYVGPLTLYLNKYRAAAQELERGGPSTSHQARAVENAPPPSPPPPVAAAAEVAVDSDEYIGLTEFLNECIFGSRQNQGGGGGEGSSSGV
ncbi:hypothetical protein ABFX02_13G120900 [Erythranthe guttata]